MNFSTSPELRITEIYLSIQGESSYVGFPCVFVRLTGCDLRCTYCDSTYAFSGGTRMSVAEVLDRVRVLGCPLVEITGGEPLLQKSVLTLMAQLCDRNRTVLLETSGAHDISVVDPRVIRIVDVKCPSSGEANRNRLENPACLREQDELKFVIGNREDYEWAKAFLSQHRLLGKVKQIFFSPVFPVEPTPGQTRGHQGLNSKTLVEWILADQLPVRFQIQIHKYIWDPSQKGV